MAAKYLSLTEIIEEIIMRNFSYKLGPCLLFLIFISAGLKAQTSAGIAATGLQGPWLKTQLIEPQELAAIVNSPEIKEYVIFNIGAVEDIKGAKHIGPVSKAENLESFKRALHKLPKNSRIVIYCGCCPFTKCPNVGPAFMTTQKLRFANVKILDLPINLKTNWIAKGYPLAGAASN